MRTPNQDDWDEIHDPSFVDWKRTRSSIEHENTLINHRLTWLLTSQVFLFAAFAMVFQAALKDDLIEKSLPVQAFLLAVASVAVTVCLYIMVSLDAAHRQIGHLENWWIYHHMSRIVHRKKHLFKVKKLKYHPPVNGMFDEWLYYIFSPRFLPFPIMVGWFGILGAVFFKHVVDYQQPFLATVLMTVGFFLIGWLGRKLLGIKRKPISRRLRHSGRADDDTVAPPSAY